MTWLHVIWFILIAVLWTVYLILEGFGIGAGMVMRLVAKNDQERAQVQATYGPVWDGNEVWLLTAGGATFAAFPNWYATLFSGMYLALFLILLCLIVRICAIEWRSKIQGAAWKSRWDTMQASVTWLVPILLGCAFGNLVQGMKIEAVARTGAHAPAPVGPGSTPNDIDPATYVHNLTGTGGPADSSFLSLLTPYTLFFGVSLCVVFIAQGLLWLRLRTTGAVYERSVALSRKITIAATVLAAICGVWGQIAYSSQALAWIPLILAAILIILATVATWGKNDLLPLVLNSAAIAAVVAWVFAAMAPYTMKSSIHEAYSLTITQASASQATLGLMFGVAVVMVPIVLIYTIWAYSTMPLHIDVDNDSSLSGLPWNRVRGGATFLSE